MSTNLKKISIFTLLFAQVLEWYTSALEVRMSQDVGVRVSSWVRLGTSQVKLTSPFFYFRSKPLINQSHARTQNLQSEFDNALILHHKLNPLEISYFEKSVFCDNCQNPKLSVAFLKFCFYFNAYSHP
jgi:hypothetical protein